MSAATVPWWRLKERIRILGSSSFWRLPTFPGSWPASTLKPYYARSASAVASSLPVLPPPLTYKDPCDYIRPMSTIQSNYLILKFLVPLSLQDPFACKVTHSQVLGMRRWTSLGDHYFAHHLCYGLYPTKLWIFLIFIEVYLTYNIMLVSSGQQRDSDICTLSQIRTIIGKVYTTSCWL